MHFPVLFVSFSLVLLDGSTHAHALQVLAGAWTVATKNILITVGGNTTGNGTTTFIPQRVDAARGDVVVFNCRPISSSSHSQDLTRNSVTNGNHTTTQSTFSDPCVPAHDTDRTINGFNSGFRYTQPGTAGTTLTVTVQNENQTLWFFDYNTCGVGGVGVINNNESSGETLVGFSVRHGVSLLHHKSCRLASATRGVSLFRTPRISHGLDQH